MPVYKFTFVKNKIDSCKIIDKHVVFEGELMYVTHNKLLIYALVKSEDEIHAIKRINRLISEHTQQ